MPPKRPQSNRSSDTGPTSLDEDFYRITQLPAEFPGHPSVQSIGRWMLFGILAADGKRVKLASIKIGGRRMVSRSAIDEFIAAINQPPRGLSDARATGTAIKDESTIRAKQAGHALDGLGCRRSREPHRT